MSKNKKNLNKIDLLEVYKKVRKGWGAISPITKVKPSKKKKSRAKKKQDFGREYKDEI